MSGLCHERLSYCEQEEEEEGEPLPGLGRRPGGGDDSELYNAAVSHANAEAAEECCRKALAAVQGRDFLTAVGACALPCLALHAGLLSTEVSCTMAGSGFAAHCGMPAQGSAAGNCAWSRGAQGGEVDCKLQGVCCAVAATSRVTPQCARAQNRLLEKAQRLAPGGLASTPSRAPLEEAMHKYMEELLGDRSEVVREVCCLAATEVSSHMHAWLLQKRLLLFVQTGPLACARMKARAARPCAYLMQAAGLRLTGLGMSVHVRMGARRSVRESSRRPGATWAMATSVVQTWRPWRRRWRLS